ncbi:MAG: glycoside hydrolase family 57 protein [Pseudomonadota bacterium]
MPTRLNVVLMWHMHQPEYRDPFSGQYQRPWTYLHALKDYVDMAAHIEAHPDARAVVNFVPVLLEQIDDYAQALKGYLADGGALPDPLLAALSLGEAPALEARAELIRTCLRAHEQRLIQRFEPYAELARIGRDFLDHPKRLSYLGDGFFSDLLVWYHLAWLGETVRRHDARALALIHKACGFDADDRRQLLELIADLMGGVIGRYRELADCGQIELTMTPYAHPIMPLLLDTRSVHEAWPQAPLDGVDIYPGGAMRVRWHLEEGLRVFERFFGRRPSGCWPSEGSVSEKTLPLLAQAGFQWCATGSQVLNNSLNQGGLIDQYRHCLHRFYQYSPNGNGNGLGNGSTVHAPALFFRDDGLSDLIGFRYADWHADHAVDDLVRHLENIATACHDGQYVASIIMDGENAWEFYPENGYYFLDALYRRLSSHPRLRLTTYQALLDEVPPRTPLPRLVAGSWVYGTFSTWIGEKDKNLGWKLLIDAKRVFDEVMEAERLDEEQRIAAERQLAICEGSDWFWWFGDYNPSEAVRDFEHLYRLHLRRLYEILGEKPPAILDQVLAVGHGAPSMGGVMRTGQAG